jgi:predicted MPP superfamily phosphohydrolase
MPADRGPITVGVLTDMQFAQVTDHERTAVERLMALRPDVIVLTGDLFQGSQRRFEEQLDAIHDLLAPLEARGGVFAVAGNVDEPSQLRAAIAGTRIRLLEDEIDVVEVRGVRLAIGGIDQHLDAEAAGRCIRRLTAEHGDADVRILLSHRPDAVLRLTEADRVDLTISGHTHGGQVRLPVLGPLVTFTAVPRQAAGGGLHPVNGHALYVSRGVGMERGQAPPIRFNCPPEVSLLTVRAKQ